MAIVTAIGVAIMGWLAYLTESLKTYAPLSYGVVCLVSLAIIPAIYFLYLSVDRLVKTNKPTLIEIVVSNGSLGTTKTSNIEDYRSFVFNEMVVYYFTFNKSINPGQSIHVEGIHGAIPKIEKQYVSSKGACIFFTQVNPNSSFRFMFNKSYES